MLIASPGAMPQQLRWCVETLRRMNLKMLRLNVAHWFVSVSVVRRLNTRLTHREVICQETQRCFFFTKLPGFELFLFMAIYFVNCRIPGNSIWFQKAQSNLTIKVLVWIGKQECWLCESVTCCSIKQSRRFFLWRQENCEKNVMHTCWVLMKFATLHLIQVWPAVKTVGSF